MKRILAPLALGLLPCAALPPAALAEQDDKGWLVTTLEENLSGAGRQVVIDGFEGALSSRATLKQLTIADEAGIWLTLRDVTLDWSRAALLRGEVSVTELTAGEIIVARAPQGDDSALPAAEAQPFALPELPVSISIGRIAATRIELGESLLGQPFSGRVEASGRLAGGEGAAQLALTRTDDGPEGAVRLDVSYANATQVLGLDVSAAEGAGGIVATLAGLPGAPAIDLAITGSGPLSDYRADLRLASDGAERLAGQVSIGKAAEGATTFAADLGGDLAPLFLPEYRDFFGTDLRLAAAGLREGSGRLVLDRLALETRALRLAGDLVLGADGLPERFALTGDLGLPDGPVVLPIGGDSVTAVQRADLELGFDAAAGQGWTARVELTGLDRADLKLAQASLAGAGQIARGAPARIDGTLDFTASGLAPADAALAAALGDGLGGRIGFLWQEGAETFDLPLLHLSGADYALTASAQLGDLAGGLTITGKADVTADDLSRFSALAGRPLSGAGRVQVQGSGAALAGSFDLTATLAGQDLALGLPEADRLLAGQSTIALSARRDETGTALRQLDITTRGLTAKASGRLASTGHDIGAQLTLADLSLLGPGYRGSLTAETRLTGTPENGRLTAQATGTALAIGQPEADRLLAGTTALQADIALRGPRQDITTARLENRQLTLTASGAVTDGRAAIRLETALANLGLLLPDFPGRATLTGDLRDSGQGYDLRFAAQGPGGIKADLAGRLAPSFDRGDLTLTGTAQAALANAFIGPRSVSGGLSFDLRLNGPLAPGSLTGRLRLADGRLADPDLPFALQDIGVTATLAGARMAIDSRATLSTGGTITTTGNLGLTAPFAGDLTARLDKLHLKDPRLYETRLNGTVTVKGPLTGGAVIGGEISLIEAELRIPDTGLGGGAGLEGLTHRAEPGAVRATRARAGLIETAADKGGGGGAAFALNLRVLAPQRVFIRGRGLDAELGGSLLLGGTTAAVVPSGAFNLVRGRLDILGKRLTLTRALLQMEGELTPYIDILASNEGAEITSSVQIQGQASNPTVSFVSTPELPQEEVLAQLLFGRDLTSLSAFQAAQLAAAVATLAGKGGEGIMSKLRKGFDLDDLDIATDAEGGTTVKAGKYLSKNLYTELGVGDDGQASITLNLDVTKEVTLRGTASGTGETSLGIFKEHDY